MTPAASSLLTAATARNALVGDDGPEVDIWGYNGHTPGPILRVLQGTPARILVTNALDQDTTVHWHGVRLPNAMDGVPGLTQPPIKPGATFTYEFTPPDAGTFWYHSHANSLEQLGRGLAGAFIVEEREPVAVDRDLVWMVADWRLNPDGQLIEITSLEPVEGQPPVEVDSALLIGRWSQAVDAFNVADLQRQRLRHHGVHG